MMHQYILFQIFHNLSLFLFFVDVYAIQERNHNISHLWQENPSQRLKFRPSFNIFLRNLIMVLICEKKRLKWLKEILNISLNIALFPIPAEPHIYLYNTLCKSNGFLICCFESGKIFKKVWLFGNFHFVILFLARSEVLGENLYIVVRLTFSL